VPRLHRFGRAAVAPNGLSEVVAAHDRVVAGHQGVVAEPCDVLLGELGKAADGRVVAHAGVAVEVGVGWLRAAVR
jgi:hypothetical protein